jgi:hypothetical protein
MKGTKRGRTVRPLAEPEPIGIVISRGSHLEPAPVVRAYVWGPAPTGAPDLITEPAA